MARTGPRAVLTVDKRTRYRRVSQSKRPNRNVYLRVRRITVRRGSGFRSRPAEFIIILISFYFDALQFDNYDCFLFN